MIPPVNVSSHTPPETLLLPVEPVGFITHYSKENTHLGEPPSISLRGC